MTRYITQQRVSDDSMYARFLNTLNMDVLGHPFGMQNEYIFIVILLRNTRTNKTMTGRVLILYLTNPRDGFRKFIYLYIRDLFIYRQGVQGIGVYCNLEPKNPIMHSTKSNTKSIEDF